MSLLTLKRSNDLAVRTAQASDLIQARRVIDESHRVHLQLDWWTLDDWIGNPGFLLAEQDGRIVGLGMGVRDAASVAWLRALVVQDGLGVGQLLDVLLPPMLASLRSQGARALNCLAWPRWLDEKLPEHGFRPLTQVVSLRKHEMTVPPLPPREASVRLASSNDLEAVVAIDHAAFEPDWWYGQTTFFRAMQGASRFIVAERHAQPVGYAFAHVSGSNAHITRLGVLPAHQRQGIGALLMADLIDYARAQGVEAMTLNTQTYNQNSLRLYHHFGFMDTDTVITAFTCPVG